MRIFSIYFDHLVISSFSFLSLLNVGDEDIFLPLGITLCSVGIGSIVVLARSDLI